MTFRIEPQQLKVFLIDSELVSKTDIETAEAKEKIDPDTLRVIPEPLARRHNIVAFKKTGKDLEIAMLDPDDLGTIDFIKKQSDLRILPRLTNTASIKQALQQYQKSLEAEFGEIIKGKTEQFTAAA